jgi:hypothetical protein
VTKRQHLLCLVEAHRRVHGRGPLMSSLTRLAVARSLYESPGVMAAAVYRMRRAGLLGPPPGRGGTAVGELELTAAGQKEIVT